MTPCATGVDFLGEGGLVISSSGVESLRFVFSSKYSFSPIVMVQWKMGSMEFPGSLNRW